MFYLYSKIGSCIFSGDILKPETYNNFIAPESIDWIITDPPYVRNSLNVFKGLIELAEYSLKEEGGMIVMTGQKYIPEIFKLMKSNSVHYCWMLAYLMLDENTKKSVNKDIHAENYWKPLFLFRKDCSKQKKFKDIIRCPKDNNDKKYHPWGQNIKAFEEIIEMMTDKDDFILDPFMGGGTTLLAALNKKRKFIGFDIDQNYVQIVNERIIRKLNFNR